MKITYQGWHTHHELASYRLAVYRNLLESAQTIVLAICKLNVDPVLPRNRVHANYKLEHSGVGVAGAAFSEDVAGAI
ncbi:hypothetical protein DFH11DRAFT_1646745, partial [Phellopilus nigrolimitatus]